MNTGFEDVAEGSAVGLSCVPSVNVLEKSSWSFELFGPFCCSALEHLPWPHRDLLASGPVKPVLHF